MACKSAWSAGAGAVVLYAPKQLLPVYENVIPEIIKVPLGNQNDSFYKSDHSPTVLGMIEKRGGTLLIGPGIGLEPETQSFVLKILRNTEKKTILDADGLSVWQDFISENGNENYNNMLLTPHPGEAKKYLNADFHSGYDRMEWVKNFVSKYSSTLFSKGYPAILGNHSGLYISGYDTSIFSRAGFGDVLAGTISTNLAISNNSELSVIRALVDGYKKAIKKKKPVEPRNLL